MRKVDHIPIGWMVKQLMKPNQSEKLVKQLQTELIERKDEYTDWLTKHPKVLENIWRY